MRDDESARMRDVAARAGVSVSTVSRALRGSPLVHPDTRARVLAAAADMSFAVSRAASSLASGRVGRIAVLVSGPIRSWFNGAIVDALYERLAAEDLELVIFRITDVVERGRFFAELPARRNADALVVASFALAPEERSRLDELGMPLVYLNQRVAGSASVSIDDAAGAALGARSLLNLGHRRLAFVHSRNRAGFAYSAAERRHGFARALADFDGGIEPEEPVLADSFEAGEQVVASLLARSRPPTAIMTESDELAMSTLAALSRTGVKVPEDLSVLGFDDHQMAAMFGLSTVAQPVEELGHAAAEMAVTLAGGTPLDEAEVIVPTSLILRRSTARPAGPEPAPDQRSAAERSTAGRSL